MDASMREWLRAQPSLVGSAPALNVSAAPDTPEELFREWVYEAAAANVPEPQAVTLATVDADGQPDARTLILKDVDRRGWAVASTRSSVKGSQLAAHPAAALNIWWQPLVRAVRVRGSVTEASPAESAADLAQRSRAARAEVNADDWVLWRVQPTRVEFWQGSTDRHHIRLVYERSAQGWRHSLLDEEHQR